MIPIAALAEGANALFRGITGIFQNRKANKIKPVDATYKVSQYAKDNLGLARQYMNARLPGAANAEQNILASQANTMASVNRNATDASQALAMAAAGQGQADQSFANLSAQEAQNSQGMLGNYMNANNAMTAEDRMVYQDQVRKYDNAVAAKNALRNAAWQNIGSAANGLTNVATKYFGNKQVGAGWGNKGGEINAGAPGLGGIQTMAGNTSINTGAIAPPPLMNPSWLGAQFQLPGLMSQQQQNAYNQPRIWRGPQ